MRYESWFFSFLTAEKRKGCKEEKDQFHPVSTPAPLSLYHLTPSVAPNSFVAVSL